MVQLRLAKVIVRMVCGSFWRCSGSPLQLDLVSYYACKRIKIRALQQIISHVQGLIMDLSKITFIAALAVFALASAAAKKPPTWCVEGAEAFATCKSIRKAMGGKIRCLLGKGDRDCYVKISKGLADFAGFDGGSVYHAGKEFGLKVFMSEKLRRLATSGTKYFGIAVVKKSSTLTFNKLRGAKSCHTGLWRTAGWVIPVGALLSSGLMPCLDGNVLKSVATFFNGSCAGGADNKRYNPSLSGAEKLCAICAGEGQAKCSRTSDEPYYGYLGAFKCMKDGAGDVAFIKESIIMRLSPDEQAKYKLLCPDNSVKEPKDFKQCNLAGSPAHGVLTRRDANEEEIAEYQKLLKSMVQQFGPNAKKRGATTIFDGSLFSRYAIGFDDVPIEKRSFISYLGEQYVNAIAKLEYCS